MADDYEGDREGREDDEQAPQSGTKQSDSKPRGRTIPTDEEDGSDQGNVDASATSDGQVDTEQTGDSTEQSRSPDRNSDVERSEGSREQAGDPNESGVSESDEQSPQQDEESEAEQLEETDNHSEIEELQEALSRTQNRIADLETQLEDYERRNEHEHEELRKYTVEELAANMLQVKDMLADSIEMETLEKDTEQRLRMVKKQFDKVLTSGRIERIEPEERDEFDDRLHRMMGKVSTDEHEPEQITNVLEVGYKTNDRVIRPARVEVAE